MPISWFYPAAAGSANRLVYPRESGKIQDSANPGARATELRRASLSLTSMDATQPFHCPNASTRAPVIPRRSKKVECRK